MAQGRQRDALDVVGCHVRTALDESHCLCAAHERQSAARATAHREAWIVTGRTDHSHRIVHHLLVHTLPRRERLPARDGKAVETRLHARERQLVARLVGGGAHDHGNLLLARWVADLNLEEKPVELRLRQRIGPFRFDRILRGEHHERLRQGQGAAFERDLILLHHFEQGALRLRRRAIDLVRQQHVREHRSAYQSQLTSRRVEHRVAGDVRRHHVRRELDAGMCQRECLRERAHEQRLAETRDALDEDVAGSDEGYEHLLHRRCLADHRLTDSHAQFAELPGGLQCSVRFRVLHEVTFSDRA